MKHFGKYRLMERIAVGGTAEVFRATASWADGDQEQVVLKKILPQHARNTTFRDLFHEEALLLASLKHPNIVALRDFGELKGTLFLALEHVEGADLDVLLHRADRAGEPLSPPLAAFIAAEICRALECIHTRTASDGTPLRIVHRDISPHNILVSREGEVKLADFGIAKSAIRMGRTTEGTIKGKFDYLSPEQASPGDPVDARADLFALGSVLYEMLLGRPPFRGKTEVETLERVRAARCELDEEALPPPHRPLLAVVRRCLHAAPDDRAADAAELCSSLDGYLQGLDDPVGAGDLARWVERIGGDQRPGSSIDGLVRDIFAPGRHGATAVVSGGREGDTPPPDPGPRLRRGAIALLLVGVAAGTAALTLALSRYLTPERSYPDPPPPAAAPPVARPALPTVPDSGLPTPDLTAPATMRPDAGRPWLEVHSVPPGAELTVNGLPAGTTPAALPAPARRFRLRLSRPGYHPWTRRFPAPSRDLRVEARLRRRPQRKGALTVNSIPWARVYLDGQSIGTTPVRALPVAAGDHRVVLKDGRGRVLRSFVTHVRPGHTSVHSFDRGKNR